MRVLGCDVETTGLDAEKDKVIEIGAAVWCFEANKPLALMSRTIELNEPLSDEIKGITGITQAEVSAPLAIPLSVALYEFESMLSIPGITHLMAHNAEFDRAFIEQAQSHSGFDCFDLPWIDTLTDVPYPESIGTRKLAYLAAEHGFVLDFAHRALFDVLAMCKIASMYDPEEICKLAASPTIRVVGKQKFHENHLAKAQGFKWDGEKKTWFKDVKECNLDEEIKRYDFPYKVLGSSEGN